MELAGYQAVYPDPEWPLAETLRRVRPSTVLIDCDHEGGFTDAFIDRALASGARVFIYSPSRMQHDVQRCALDKGLPWFTMPIDLPALRHLITGTRESTGGASLPEPTHTRQRGC